ncbi:hypothetical protein ACLOJK_019340 [Asimina triloba]
MAEKSGRLEGRPPSVMISSNPKLFHQLQQPGTRLESDPHLTSSDRALFHLVDRQQANAQIHQRSRAAARRPIIRLEQGSMAHQRHHHPIDFTQKPQFRTHSVFQ